MQYAECNYSIIYVVVNNTLFFPDKSWGVWLPAGLVMSQHVLISKYRFTWINDVRVNSDGVDIHCKYARLYQVNKKL